MVLLSEGCKTGPSLCTSSATIIRFHSLACCQELLALTQELLNESVKSAMNMDKFKYVDHILLVHRTLLDLTNTVCLEQKRFLVWIFLVVGKSHHPHHSVWQQRNEQFSGHWHVSLLGIRQLMETGEASRDTGLYWSLRQLVGLLNTQSTAWFRKTHARLTLYFTRLNTITWHCSRAVFHLVPTPG